MDLNIHQSTSKGLAIISGQPTMTSIELHEIINAARRVENEPIVQSNHFLARIEDELEGELADVKVLQNPTGGRPRRYYDLTLDQCLLVGMRESKAVRRSVLAELNKRQNQIPQTLPEALRLAADLAEKNEALSIERDEAIRTKAQIGNSREATAMATASAARREAKRLKNELGKGTKQATITAVEIATGEKLGRRAYIPLRKWCKEHGVNAADVRDDRYGSVKAWPAGAWIACFDVDLTGLFGGKE